MGMLIPRTKISAYHEYSAAAEVIGALVLVSLIVAVVAIIAVFSFSQPTPEKIPALNLKYVFDGSDTLKIYHEGGDAIPAGQYKVLINNQDVTADIEDPPSDSWSIGEALTITLPDLTPESFVEVIYNNGGRGSAIISINGTPFGGGGPTPLPAEGIVLNANKNGILNAGGSMQFRVTGSWSQIIHGSTTYNLNPNDVVKLVIGSDSAGEIDITSAGISSFSFNDVRLFINGVDRGTGTVSSIWVSGFDQYSSTLSIDVPPYEAGTFFSVDSVTLIEWWPLDSSRIQVFNLHPNDEGAMHYNSYSGHIEYWGGTTGYLITPSHLVVTANFMGIPLSGMKPLTVQFTDLSTGPVTSWYWEFGDGNTSTIKSPSNTYQSDGNYTVSLKVGNGTGFHTLTQPGYINVSAPVVSKTIVLNAAKPGILNTGGIMQFRVTGSWSQIILGTTTYNLNQNDLVKLVVGSDKAGRIDATSTTISSFSFDDVRLFINGVDKGTGTVNTIWISGYDQYSSTLSIDVPSYEAGTFFSVDSVTLINWWPLNASRIQVFNLRPPNAGTMNLNSESNIQYAGGASDYLISNTVPTITSITPSSGPTTAGTRVNITGTNLAGVTSVLFGSNPATVITNTATTINLTAPAGSAGSVTVNVTTPSGSATTSYTYAAIIPTITSISPSSGPTTVGTRVNITGTNLAGVTSVKFGSNAATILANTATTINMTAPAGSAGTVTVNVTTPNGSATTPYTYTVVTPAPTVTGRTNATLYVGWTGYERITGTNFVSGATSVLNTTTGNSIPSTTCVITSATSMFCSYNLLGAPVSTSYRVAVINPDGKSGLMTTNLVSVTSPRPTLTARSPSSAVKGWPVSVTLTGTGFQPGATVNMTRTGAVIDAYDVVVVSPTSITCKFNLAGATTGTYIIRVTNPDKQFTASTSMTLAVTSTVTVTGITPSSGKRGTTVTISNIAGTGFQPGVTQVRFTTNTQTQNQILLTNINVVSSTMISGTLVIPPGQSAATYYVRVTNADATTRVSGSKIFTVTT